MAALVGYPRLPMKNFTFFVAQWNRGEKNLGECCRCASSWKNHLGTLQQVDDGQWNIVISSWNMIFTYTLPLKKNFEDRRNRGDIGWATSSVFPCGFSNFFVLVRSGCKKRLGASRWRQFFAWKNVSEHGRPESGVARYSSSWFSYTIGSLPQGPKLRSLTHSTSTSKTLSPDTRFAHG